MKYVLTSYIEDGEEMVSPPKPFLEAREIFALSLGFEPENVKIEEGEELAGAVISPETMVEETITMRPAEADDLVEIIDGEPQLDAVIEEFTDDRFKLAWRRAVASFGDLVDDYENDDFIEEFGNQLKIMATQDVYQCLVKKGLITSAVEVSGEIVYHPA